MYRELPVTLVIYSSVHDIDKDLDSLYASLGKRKVSVVREISKMYEEVIPFCLGEKVNFVHKGEFVLVVEGGRKDFSALSVTEHYGIYIAKGLSKKDAIKQVASDRGVAKSEIYAIIVKGEENAIQKG